MAKSQVAKSLKRIRDRIACKRSASIVKTFTEAGDFEAANAAEKWCEENGISVGAMQGSSPRGLLYGEWCISKWRNMNDQEQFRLDGTMTGDMRNGPVVVSIKERT